MPLASTVPSESNGPHEDNRAGPRIGKRHARSQHDIRVVDLPGGGRDIVGAAAEDDLVGLRHDQVLERVDEADIIIEGDVSRCRQGQAFGSAEGIDGPVGGYISPGGQRSVELQLQRVVIRLAAGGCDGRRRRASGSVEHDLSANGSASIGCQTGEGRGIRPRPVEDLFAGRVHGQRPGRVGLGIDRRIESHVMGGVISQHRVGGEDYRVAIGLADDLTWSALCPK